MPLKIPKKQKIKLKEGRISRLPQKTNLKAHSFYYPVSRKLREIKKKKIHNRVYMHTHSTHKKQNDLIKTE